MIYVRASYVQRTICACVNDEGHHYVTLQA